ncbi:hypothetical protein VNPA120661_19690 [Pseudomonas aeruginosa]|nr:hypothetical protein HMPREF1224_07899 [Pseudomonas sp. P179]KYO92501.1 hypothetical protein LT19_01786 [Pseudomonas aeruginosa]GLE81656.1 hypothetical protein VNPA120661_19690 [Pseudomonas aeruginosa]GLF38543.1 hypothetical protein VNPA141709_12940 [Pseudomonas aeruginosa]GLF69427.1 hypothetical protein VNPA152080_08430 [Pseudomonas aeruginosa]
MTARPHLQQARHALQKQESINNLQKNPMNAFIRYMLVAMLLVLSQKSFALMCWKSDNKQTEDYVYIDTSIAVPSVLPKDTVLWRSPNYSISITCFQDRDWGPEQVYFYLSPTGQGALGSDLEVGINLNGEDLRCSTLDIVPKGDRHALRWLLDGTRLRRQGEEDDRQLQLLSLQAGRSQYR